MANPKYRDLPLAITDPVVQLRLTRVMEECAEVAQMCSKLLRFGFHDHHPRDPEKQSNWSRFLSERKDLMNALTDLDRDTEPLGLPGAPPRFHVELCDMGHEYPKFANRENHGCPACMHIGLDLLRREIQEWRKEVADRWSESHAS